MRAEEMSAVVDDAPTRERVATSILEHGPSTAADLARRLGLTPAAVRRHLDLLLADGVVAQRQPRATTGRGRGRPAKVFMITDAGRDTFAHAYDDLAVDALGFLAETAGDGAVVEFAARRLRGLTAKYRPLVDAAPVDERPRVLAEALSADGFAASKNSFGRGLSFDTSEAADIGWFFFHHHHFHHCFCSTDYLVLFC